MTRRLSSHATLKISNAKPLETIWTEPTRCRMSMTGLWSSTSRLTRRGLTTLWSSIKTTSWAKVCRVTTASVSTRSITASASRVRSTRSTSKTLWISSKTRRLHLRPTTKLSNTKAINSWRSQFQWDSLLRPKTTTLACRRRRELRDQSLDQIMP